MPRRRRARGLAVRLLLVLCLLLPGTPLSLPLPAGAAAARRSSPGLSPGTTPDTASAGPAISNLALTWSTSSTHVGVPVSLSLRLLDGDGQLEPRGATVDLTLSDALASVAGQPGTPLPDGARFPVTLTHGQATVSVVFATAGVTIAFASLTDDADITGSASLPVGDVFFAFDGPVSLVADSAQPYLLSVRDDQGSLVTDYQGQVLVGTDDPGALLTTPSQDASTVAHRLSLTFAPADHGQRALRLALAQPGARHVTLQDSLDSARQVTVPLSVTASAALNQAARATQPHVVFLSGTPSFGLSLSSSSTNAGVQLSLTVTALDALGARDSSYRGTVALSATDPAFSPGSAYRYTFTSTDAGQHVFPVSFNTAGSQTISASDTHTSSMSGTSPGATVAETYLSVTPSVYTITQGTNVTLTLAAKTGSGTLVSGYRGTVAITSIDSCLNTSTYTFTSSDAGQHNITAKFNCAGSETITVSDQALPSRNGSAGPITVQNTAPTQYSHESEPSGVQLADGSLLVAYLSNYGQLFVRRNVGTLAAPAWQPAVLVRDTIAGPLGSGTLGADTPSLVAFNGQLALFHTYSDGSIYQVWLTTSSDNGASWSTPVQLTHDQTHVQRVQAVVSGGTLALFWSHQDISGQLFEQTTSDLSSWSSPAVVGQAVGPQIAQTTANFGITQLVSGQWLLGWLATSLVNEQGVANNLAYPTVHVASSSDLASWSSPVELNLPYSQRWPRSVSLAQDPGSGQIDAAIDRYTFASDHYVSLRTSGDGVSWGTEATLADDRSQPADGAQGYTGQYPAIVPGAMVLLNSVWVTGTASVVPGYGGYSGANSGRAVSLVDLHNPAQASLMPYGDNLPMADCATGQCVEVGYPVNALTGAESAGAIDLSFPAIGAPLTVSRSYTSSDGLAGQDSAFGIGWHWSYGVKAVTFSDGSVAIVEASGREAMFWRQGSGWVPAAYINATLAAGSGGGYVLTRQDQSVWTFDSTGRLLSIADRNGNSQTLSYTGGVISGITAPGGRSLTITTDTSGHITQLSGPGGIGSSYSYDANGNLRTATDPAGAVTSYSYDSRHELLTVVDGNQHTVERNVYGSLGRVTQQTDANNQVTSFSYATLTYAGGSSFNTVTDPRGNQLRFFFDASWRMSERQAYQGGSTKLQDVHYSYDPNGDLTQLTDGNGVVTTYTYDSHGNLLSQTVDAGSGKLNLQSSFSYDSLNDRLSATDPLNHTTTYTYDGHGNRLTATDPLSHTTSYSYNTLGQLTSVSDASNRSTSFGYDSAGDLTTITAPGSLVTTLGYDAPGRLTSSTDPLNHSTSFSLNGRGQLLALTNALNQTTSYGYDLVGNRTSVTDALNHTTTSSYDVLNRLTSITDALNQTTSFAYDATSNLVSVTDANSHTTSFSYDALNRRSSQTDALSHTTSYSYDANGNLTQTRDAKGVTNRSVYDHANRLTGVDLGNNGTLDIQQGYDAASRRTSLTYPSTHQVSYGYDPQGRLASVSDWLSQTTSYGYDAASRLTSVSFPNGVSGTLGYDDANRLTSLDYSLGGTSLQVISYGLNAVGDRTTLVDNSGTTTYGYDALDRLTSVDYPNGDAVGYGYDPVGNRTSLTVNGTLTSNTFNADNQLTASGSDAYSYDLNGNLTSKTVGGVTTTYGYDQLNRLTSITGPTTASYVYNGDGLRVGKIVNGTTTNYSWDPTGLGHVLSDSNEYVWGLGLIGQITSGGSATYAQSDGLGSIRLLTDGSGTVVGSQAYDAFGASRAQSGMQLPFGFDGEQVDAESGLVYLRARYEDPNQGRFLTADPLGFGGGDTNLYRYVHSAPTNVVDPSGLDDMMGAGGGMGGGGAILAGAGIGLAEELQQAGPELAQEVENAAAECSTEVSDEVTSGTEAVEKTARHHLFPQARKFRQAFEDAGVKIHRYTVELPTSVHQALHSGPFPGGSWNKAWDDFFSQNPRATAEEIQAFAQDLSEKAGIAGEKVMSYWSDR